MTRQIQKLILMSLPALMIFLLPFESYAQWSNDPDVNTQVSLFTGQPTLVSDGDNGVIIFSQSRDVNSLLRAQRIDVKGDLRWPGVQGVRVSSAVDAQWIREPVRHERHVLADSEGGAYIAYQVGKIIGHLQEPPEEIYATSAYLQHLDASGERLLGEDGLMLMPIQPDTFEFSQRIMNMIPDGEQGVYMLWWVDGFDSTQYNGVFVKRIAASGSSVWDTKRLTDRDNQYIPYLDNNLNLNLLMALEMWAGEKSSILNAAKDCPNYNLNVPLTGLWPLHLTAIIFLS